LIDTECASINKITNQSGSAYYFHWTGPASKPVWFGHHNTKRHTLHSHKQQQFEAGSGYPCLPVLNSTRTGISNPFDSREEATRQFASLPTEAFRISDPGFPADAKRGGLGRSSFVQGLLRRRNERNVVDYGGSAESVQGRNSKVVSSSNCGYETSAVDAETNLGI